MTTELLVDLRSFSARLLAHSRIAKTAVHSHSGGSDPPFLFAVRIMSRRSRKQQKQQVAQQPVVIKSAHGQKTFSAHAALRASLSRGQPGSWSSDHRAEAEHITDWNYIAIRSLCMQAMKASVLVFDDSGRTGELRKSQRQFYRKTWRGDPSHRSMNRQYWHHAKKSLYGEEGEKTSPLPSDSLIVRLMKTPNSAQSGAIFRYEQVMQLQATGSCIVWNVPNKLGKTVERHVIPTAIAQPVNPSPELPRGGFRVDPASSRFASPVDEQGFVELTGYFAAIGKVIPIEQCQIIRWPHPYLKDDGYAPLAAGSRLVDTADQITTARFSQMKNGFEPSLVINLGEDVEPTQEELQTITEQISQKYCGSPNHRKVLIIAGGQVVSAIGTSPKDMDYATGFLQSRDSILALHGTPPVMVGVQEAGAFAAYYASLKQGTDLMVQPILDLLAEEDSRWFSTRRPDPLNPQGWILEYPEGTTVEIEAAPIDDLELRERQLTNDVAWGIRTVDEVRSERGMPLLGGDAGKRIAGQAGFVPSLPDRPQFPQTGLSQKPAEAPEPAATPMSGQTLQTEETPSNIATSVSLNGAQITAATTVLEGVASGTTAAVVATELLLALGIQEESVSRMVRAAQKQQASNAGGENGTP